MRMRAPTTTTFSAQAVVDSMKPWSAGRREVSESAEMESPSAFGAPSQLYSTLCIANHHAEYSPNFEP